jgi:hypothetical protein
MEMIEITSDDVRKKSIEEIKEDIKKRLKGVE